MAKEVEGVVFYDYSEEVLQKMQEAVMRALEGIGAQAEGYAKDLAPVDTGLLQNSITFALSGQPAKIDSYSADNGGKPGKYAGRAPDDGIPTVYIGTNVEYAAHVELGTGAKNTPGGRPGSWGYIDDAGQAHHTSGHQAKPFLKPAVADHAQTYRNIIEDELKNG